MIEIAAVVMIVAAFTVGYGVRALQHPAQHRDKSGRFTKGK